MRKILVVVDMQNDFIDGSLGTPEALAIVENVKKKISQYDQENIFVTMDTHEENYMQTQEGKNLPVPHCIRGTEGWRLNPTIREAAGDCELVEKPTFGSTELPKAVKDCDEFILLGLCTDICVISNAMIVKAFLPEVPVRVDASCCAGVTPESHENALAAMKCCQIEII